MFIKINNPYTRFKLFFTDLTDEKKKDRMAMRALYHVMSSNLYGEKMEGMISEITQAHPTVRKYLTVTVLLMLFKKLCREKISTRDHLTRVEYEYFLCELYRHLGDNPTTIPEFVLKLEIEAFKVFISSWHDIFSGNNLSYADFGHLRVKHKAMASRSFFESTKVNAYLKMQLAENLGLKAKAKKFERIYVSYLLKRIQRSASSVKTDIDELRRLKFYRIIEKTTLLRAISENCNPARIDRAMQIAELLDQDLREKVKEELLHIKKTFSKT